MNNKFIIIIIILNLNLTVGGVSYMKQVCVIGAGVIGLSVATHLLEAYHDDIVVTVIADKFSPDTTASDIAGGIVVAPVQEDKARSKVWISDSVKRFRMMHDSSEKTGVSYSSGCFVKPEYDKDPIWFKELVSNYQTLDVFINEKFAKCEKAKFSTFIVTGTDYMTFLMHKIRTLGGILVEKNVESLSELSSFDVIVNCAGLAARELASDSAVYPVKGLLVAVHAPWIKEWFNEAGTHDGRAYIFPRVNEVVLGGCNEINKEDSQIDSAKVQEVIDRCQQIMPSLAGAEVIKVLVGVRPMRRGGVRLEGDEKSVDGSLVVHNYGHGSYGITLSWGCAVEVGDIVGCSLGLVKKTSLSSKL